MTFRRKAKDEDPDHPRPVEIDLGTLKQWQADVVLADMEGRFRMKAVQPDSGRYQGMMTPTYKVLVHPDDEAEVRAELIDTELLER